MCHLSETRIAIPGELLSLEGVALGLTAEVVVVLADGCAAIRGRRSSSSGQPSLSDTPVEFDAVDWGHVGGCDGVRGLSLSDRCACGDEEAKMAWRDAA